MTDMPDHAQLVEDAAWWLRRDQQCSPVLKEPAFADECPDAIGWRVFGQCRVVECKTSEADRKKEHEKDAKLNKARLGGKRWLLCPAGLFDVADAQELRMGLLYWHGPRQIQEVKSPALNRGNRRDFFKEYVILRGYAAQQEWHQLAGTDNNQRNRKTVIPKHCWELLKEALDEDPAITMKEATRIVRNNSSAPKQKIQDAIRDEAEDHGIIIEKVGQIEVLARSSQDTE